MSDTEVLLGSDYTSSDESSISGPITAARRHRLDVGLTAVILAIGGALGLLGWGQRHRLRGTVEESSHRPMTELQGAAEELPAVALTKEDYHGIPIYSSPRGGGGAGPTSTSSVWTISMPEGCSSAELQEVADNLPGDLEPIYQADPDRGGAPVLMVRGPLAALKVLLDSGDFEGAGFAEEDTEMAPIPEEPSDEEGRLLAVVSWGIDRVDDRELPLDNTFEPSGTGAGSHVYVLDTGIRTTHRDFEGRSIATMDFTTVGRPTECHGRRDCAADRQGHGTHCAGSIAGAAHGIAKGATLHAMKVLPDQGRGRWTWFTQAVDWVTVKGQRPAVASASLGARGRIRSVQLVIDNALLQGVVVVVAAGNRGRSASPDACDYSPAFVRAAITVGSSTQSDARSDFSNYGSCVDIFAPGSNINSVSHLGERGSAVSSGTSLACSHVSGAVAVLMQQGTNASDVERVLMRMSTRDRLFDVRGSPNKLLFVGLWCPPRSAQVGGLNADVPGCGLTNCSERYHAQSVAACLRRCRAHHQCKAFSWAPKGGDRNHLEDTVCGLYATTTPTAMWGPKQILCTLGDSEPEASTWVM